MTEVVEDIVAFFRMFSSLEREQICCGTVSTAQCVLLQTLLEGEWDVSSLAAQTRVTKSAMTRLVDGLEARGWVTRDKGPNDGRRVVVSLTAEGHEEAQRLLHLTEQGVAAILEAIPAAERNQVMHSIHLLRQAAEQRRDQLDCC
jgi:DNA-binding MarR family transcriptional regulator